MSVIEPSVNDCSSWNTFKNAIFDLNFETSIWKSIERQLIWRNALPLGDSLYNSIKIEEPFYIHLGLGVNILGLNYLEGILELSNCFLAFPKAIVQFLKILTINIPHVLNFSNGIHCLNPH